MHTLSAPLILGLASVAVLAVGPLGAFAETVPIGNRLFSLSFDARNGALSSIRNVATGDEYLKHAGATGNPFVVYVDPTVVPRFASDPGWWSGEVEADLGGKRVDAGACAKPKIVQSRRGNARQLTIETSHAETAMGFRLRVSVADRADYADLTLTITNRDAVRHSVVPAFPHLCGLSLGRRPETNLGLMLASYGTPGVKAWTNSGGWYGREVSMQWQAAYEPSLDEGIGLIVMDPETRPKLLRRSEGGVLSALHYPGMILEPGASVTLPTVRLLVHRGSWRVTAKAYRDWYMRAFQRRHPPSWLGEVDLYSGGWIPSAEEVAKTKAGGRANAFVSFEQMPLLYKDGPYDLIEWAMYNQGVLDAPETYGPYMGDGTYYFRSDLGGPDAMREGVRRLHAMGRRIMFYVAGNSVLRTSAVLKGTREEDWLLMDRPGHGYDIGYPNGISVCPGYGPWQDHLARTARRILQETGADGIRLDELAGFVPCFNPAHKHDNPYDSVKWLRELTRKVRAAMDEVNPDAILLTENPLDAVHESCNGALQMFQPGYDIDAMRVAVPTYVGMAYHPGAVESALNGWIGGKTTARRVTWPWEHRGLSGKPEWYADGPGPEMRWHELRASFPEALTGDVALRDPAAENESKWAGRLWTGKRYWLMIGGTLDATPLSGALRVTIPYLPYRIAHAYEFDAQTLDVRETVLGRNRTAAQRPVGGSPATATVHAPLAAVLLPLPDCPPAVMPQTPSEVNAGQTLKIRCSLMATGSRAPATAQATVAFPGILATSIKCVVPGEISIAVPSETMPGLYPLRISGPFLPVKRWIRVKEANP